MQFRHEVKHEIGIAELFILRQRLRAVMQPDKYATNGRYFIRSLYFDTPDDKALREKLDGVYIREKYRIRLYNHDLSFLRLERKYKMGALGYKETAALTADEAQAIAGGDTAWMAQKDNAVLRGFYERMLWDRLRPKVIVDYMREPFVYVPGNVRVTLDYDIRTGLGCTDFLRDDCVTIPVKDAPCILEVKWDEYLPDVIRAAVQLDECHSIAYSKYAACRMYD